MDQVQLARVIGIDGWYFVIAAVGGLLGGTVLMWLRRSDPLVLVVLLVIGAGIAAWVMVSMGVHLGPPDPDPVLRAAKEGATVPVQLRLKAQGVELAWPLGAVVGALLVLLLVTPRPAAQAES